MAFQKRWIEGKTIKHVECFEGEENNLQQIRTAVSHIEFTDRSRITLYVETTEDQPFVGVTYHKAAKPERNL